VSGRDIAFDDDEDVSSDTSGVTDAADATDGSSAGVDGETDGSIESTSDVESTDVGLTDAEPSDVAHVTDGSVSPDTALPDAESSDTTTTADGSPDSVEDASPDAGPDVIAVGAGTCESPVIAIVGATSAIPTVDEQSPGCLSIDENEAVFAFTPPASGTYCVDTRGSEAFDTLVSVRTTCGDVDTELVCYDDFTTEGVEFRGFGTFTATNTDQVFVLVDTFSYRAGQSVTLTISEGSCPGDVTDPGGGADPDLGEASCVDDVVDVADDFVPGDTFRIRCPSGCAGRDFVYGTDIYTDDSWICGASIHAGAITDAGGQVRVTIAAGQAVYVGSTRNGVTTDDWTTGWSRSFTVEAP
jgi:hypothetical protein